MTKTANYQLNQWEPADEVRREDFNSDNAAIDAAIKAVADTAAGKASAEELAAVSQTVSTLSETVNAHKIAVGSYTGNGGTQTISVGFTPKVVFVHNRRVDMMDGYLSAMAITGSVAHEQYNNTTLLAITTNGFKVTHGSSATVNSSAYTYLYLAIC